MIMESFITVTLNANALSLSLLSKLFFRDIIYNKNFQIYTNKRKSTRR